ncbi:hypothetical protein [Curtobacterium sp. MCLR17_034]|uniref:hypothetical protein n=1 Tax=Curtobacterium sp. MCLR17_034 TaxID=2175623 RepID=UPI0011B78CD6|nr:hypothetical protein [Curtobacterium sp. MCLR17_034]
MTAPTPEQMRALALQDSPEDSTKAATMTNAVNLDALRDTAWNEYTAAGKSQGLLFGMDKSPREAFTVGFNAAAAEVGRLRADLEVTNGAARYQRQRAEGLHSAIENAPHGRADCAYATPSFPNGFCICWKAEAL